MLTKSDDEIRAEIKHCTERLMRMAISGITPLQMEERTALTARKNALLWVLE
jgi:hypothetical protein